MSRFRTFTSLAACSIAATVNLPIGADAETLVRVGPSTKVCQLIGDVDWLTGMPTAAQTETNYGLHSVDLGFPVDASPGKLYFLFGDTVALNPNPPYSPTNPKYIVEHPRNSIPTVPPDDALGSTTRTAAPDAQNCLGLELETRAATPKRFAHPTVQPPIQQGSFNVPSGGVFLNNTFYAFFWTDHCFIPTGLTPDPVAPLRRPAPSAACPEIPENSSLGRSVLAAATPPNVLDFQWTAAPGGLLFRNMPSGFNYVSAAAKAPDIPPSLTMPHGAIAVFGVPRYRASIPYLALAPQDTFGDPQTWWFFSGSNATGSSWVTRQQWENGQTAAGDWTPPAAAEIFQASPAGERCVGEHSVTWNAALRTWLLLYTCTPLSVEARFAPEPWGPWSAPIVLLDAVQNPDVGCTLVMSLGGCGSQPSSYLPLPNGASVPGAFYAPFVMERFTQDETPKSEPGRRSPKRARIYWLLSTWNPYTVVVMQSTLDLLP
jgi:Domain of unknown function (DUF4185)